MKQIKFETINPYVRYAKLQYQPIRFRKGLSPYGSAPDWRLFIIEKGRTGICIDGDKISASKNSVIIIPPKTPYYFFKQTDHDGLVDVIVIHVFNFDLFTNKKSATIPPLSPTDKTAQEIQRYENFTLREFSPYYVSSISSKAKDYLDDLRIKKSLEQTNLDTTTCSCILKLALIEILRNANSDQDTKDLISEITTYVASNINKNYNIKQMANDLFYHPFYISKVFKSVMKVSLHEYIVSERLLYSKALLESSDDPIDKISSKSGFVNVSHFCKQFNKYFSISPAKYRKKSKLSE